MKVCSFLPAVTQMIYDLELQDNLHGITFECPSTALAEKARVVRCILEGNTYNSIEIDRIFSASKAQGKSLYYVDEAILQEIAPDIIFTQDVCEICQIDTVCTSTAVAKLEKQPQLISISPQSLEDVFQSVITIAEAIGQEEKAYQHLQNLRQRIDVLIDIQRANRILPKRVSLLEWINPIYNCAHWIPHQIAYAGGIDMLSNPSGDSIVTDWQKIRRYDPEVLVIAPCGFNVSRTLEEVHLLTEKEGWSELQAVQNNNVHIIDFELFTQPSASTLVDGIEVLAGVFHPDFIEIPAHLQEKYCHFETLVTV